MEKKKGKSMWSFSSTLLRCGSVSASSST